MYLLFINELRERDVRMNLTGILLVKYVYIRDTINDRRNNIRTFLNILCVSSAHLYGYFIAKALKILVRKMMTFETLHVRYYTLEYFTLLRGLTFQLNQHCNGFNFCHFPA